MVLGRERREKVRSNDDGRDQPFDFPKAAFPKAVKARIMITLRYLTSYPMVQSLVRIAIIMH